MAEQARFWTCPDCKKINLGNWCACGYRPVTSKPTEE